MTANTGEPTHVDDAGATRPGAKELDGKVNPTTVKEIEATWKEHYADNQLRNHKSSQFPNLADPYSPLDSLITEAILRFGNMAPETVDGNVRLMLLRYANSIIEDIRAHPYGSLPDLDYYTSLSETRPIPDEIMISGLAFHYAKWNKSKETKIFFTEYQKTIGQILYQRKFGMGKIQMNTVDKEEAPE